MKKYKYQCDNSKCNHQFIDDNPTSCPKCGKDDFTIISQINPNKKYILFIFLIFVAVSVFLILKNIGDDDSSKDNLKSNKLLLIETYDNYFVIKDSEGFDTLILNGLGGVGYFKDESKIFPCKSGKFKISADKGNISEDTIIEFNLEDDPDIRACQKDLEVWQVLWDKGSRIYKIETSDDERAVVSLNPNSGFQNKLKWDYDDCLNSKFFYVKLKNSDKNPIKEPKPKGDPPPDPIDPKQVAKEFNEYLKDPRNNRLQFVDYIEKYNPIFIYNDEENDLGDIIATIETLDPDSLNSLMINYSNIESDDNSMVIKISK